MNKWEDSFKKNEHNCQCLSNNGLFVPNRQLSLIVAGLLFLAFSIFMTGYFLGKKNIVEQFSEKIQQEAFADQVYASVLSSTQEGEQKNIDTFLVTNAEVVDIGAELLTQPISQEINQKTVVAENTLSQDISVISYYAQLIGFGTEKAAQLFVNKLATKGIETEIKKRTSKTVKGRACSWYQVVTTAYANKNDLVALVDKIAKEENIKDASIRAC